jgi:RNA 2',3'-cyclic 3'-phosphodiesterase
VFSHERSHLRPKARASLKGRERLRLFVALLLPDEALARLAAWQHEELGAPAAARVVPRENLHVTLAFLGSTDASELAGIAAALRATAPESEPPVFEPVRYRETRSVGMVVLSDEGNRAGRLAERLFGRLEELGVYERERRPWLPHVTVLRFRQRPRLTPLLPDLGRVVSSEMAVMMSRLRPSGAQYEVLESVPVGG